MSGYNLRSPAVKRLMREAEELRNPSKDYHAAPLEDNLFEWHFTLRGPANTEFENGIYHGRITLPPEYPMRPPSIILLTPNGRFETNKKICLSISGYHPETWQPSWSIRTALLALIGFLPSHGNGAIGALDYSPEERKELASKSQDWKCPLCGNVKEFLLEKEFPDGGRTLHSPTSADKVHLNEETQNSMLPSSEALPKMENFKKTDESSNKPHDIQQNNSLPVNPSISQEDDHSLRHRQQTPLQQSSQNVETTNEIRPQSYNWSKVVIWVIVFLLGILIFRRIFYLC